MTRSKTRTFRFASVTAVPAAVITAYLLAIPEMQAQPQTTTYVGEATVASVKALGLVDLSIEDTGPLPSTGGSLATQLAQVNVPQVVDLNLLNASTTGGSNQVTSSASVANVVLSVAGIYVAASVLTSNANASCHPGHAYSSGSSTIAALTVNGLSVTVTGQPNQTIPLIVGSLVINEQISSTTTSPGVSNTDLVVNALHLKVNLLADVVISSSHAGMSCTGVIGIPG